MLGGLAECKQTNRALAVSMRETVDICFDPPVCLELPGNWEDTFFREVAYERGEETNAAGEKGASEDEIDEPLPNVPKIASYIWLARPLHFLVTKCIMKTANEGKKKKLKH